ncbi:MAG: hypothetical protein ABSE90_07250 [Verrucomicrobiota bacterium]|jgi:hypothetical protein
MKGIVKKPIFWVGTAAVVGALYLGQGAGEGAGEGLNKALPIVGIALGLALIIYAVKS